MSAGNRNREADALLARLSVDQLRAGLERGRAKLAITQVCSALDDEDGFERIGHPGEHPSRAQIGQRQSDDDRMILHLHSAIRDTENELRRRGAAT